jgi:hypothetical protein
MGGGLGATSLYLLKNKGHEMLAIAFIVITIKYYVDLTNSQKLAIENGVKEEDYDILKIGLWFYIIPPILGFLFPFVFKIYLLPLLMLTYAPSIYYSLKVSKQLDKGYDYVRKLSNKVNQVAWIGYAGIGLVALNWLLIYLNELSNGI